MLAAVVVRALEGMRARSGKAQSGDDNSDDLFDGFDGVKTSYSSFVPSRRNGKIPKVLDT
jgi:hypothetical protein